jgi:hypothetical protein
LKIAAPREAGFFAVSELDVIATVAKAGCRQQTTESETLSGESKK